jgi:biotin transport system substrate-specific component
MHYSEIIQSYRKLRLSIFQERTQLVIAYKILLAIGMACATGFLAQVKFFLPWPRVPVVATQVGVVVAAVLLGANGAESA